MTEASKSSSPRPIENETTVGDWTGNLPSDKTSATRRHRLHQGRWRTDVAKWPAGPPQDDRRVRARYATLPNWLAPTHGDRNVEDEVVNLMSQEALTYSKSRLATLAHIDGKAEPDRFWRNLLSSQPLAFSIAGHLHHDRSGAAALLGALTELDAESLTNLHQDSGDAEHHRLDGIEAEWFPPRAHHTNDMSGCDIAACMDMADRRRVLITVEVKYTDTFSAKPVVWSRYEEHLKALGLDEATTDSLVQAGCSQVLRQVMLTNSVVLRGLISDAGPEGKVDAGMAVVLARHDDGTARRVAETLDDAVGAKIPVRFWSHRRFFEEAAKLHELRDWAESMRVRYVPDGE